MRDYEKSDLIESLIKSSAVCSLQVLDNGALIGCEEKNHYLHGFVAWWL
jgi:hypothetical protein